MTNVRRAGGGRNGSVLVAGSIVEAIRDLKSGGVEPTFNAILAHLRTTGVLSNHRSLRAYLDTLTASGLLAMRAEPSRQPNIRPRQVYSVARDGPFVEAGEKALVFHGLNWTIPTKSSGRLRTDLEGVVRARLQDGTLYGSLEDVVADSLARAEGRKAAVMAIPYCAALLATKRFDRAYLLRRADELGVGESVRELLDEIHYLFASPKPEMEDLKSLFATRRWAQSTRHRIPVESESPRWSLLSKDELLDVVGKQLGVK